MKFRGLPKVKGKSKMNFIYGYYYYNHEYKKAYIIDDYDQRIVMPETVGQYTGLKDKNGQEIYDGDIVIIDTISEKTRVVEYDNCRFYCYWISRHGIKVIQDFSEIRSDEIELYSNIHENPELLES